MSRAVGLFTNIGMLPPSPIDSVFRYLVKPGFFNQYLRQFLKPSLLLSLRGGVKSSLTQGETQRRRQELMWQKAKVKSLGVFTCFLIYDNSRLLLL
jgi:hypothetical protein